MAPHLKIIISAIVQGLTEFLPVSSSGHLVLVGHFLDLDSPGVLLEVALHAGTLCSVLIYYRRRLVTLVHELLLWRLEARRYVLSILVASVPAIGVYLSAGDWIETCFDSPRATSAFLLVTGLVLLTLRVPPRRSRDVAPGAGFLIGIGQAFALLPGVSRSGMTVTAGRRLGLDPARAAEFSMLMAVPILTGAILVTVLEAIRMPVREMGDLSAGSLVLGGVVAALVGYLAIACLVRMLTAGKLWLFGIYCLAAGALCMAICD